MFPFLFWKFMGNKHEHFLLLRVTVALKLHMPTLYMFTLWQTQNIYVVHKTEQLELCTSTFSWFVLN